MTEPWNPEPYSITQTGNSELEIIPAFYAEGQPGIAAKHAALVAIAELAEHCAFAAAALPATEDTLRWIGKQFCEAMDIAREGAGLPAKGWHKEPTA